MIYVQLFFSFLQIGAFSFGGGYAALPLIQEQVVDRYGWLKFGEFSDLITISQMTPGPIAINAATFVGIKAAGLGGALISTLGCVLPACILVSILAAVYMKYQKINLMQQILGALRPAVAAMIAAAGAAIILSAFWGEQAGSGEGIKLQNVVIFGLALYLLKGKRWNPILVMVLAGGMELLYKAVMVYILKL